MIRMLLDYGYTYEQMPPIFRRAIEILIQPITNSRIMGKANCQNCKYYEQYI
jgi:hypothetical protein